MSLAAGGTPRARARGGGGLSPAAGRNGEQPNGLPPSEASPEPSKMKRREEPGGGQPPVPRFLGIPMKWVSLTSLTLQTSAQVFIIKWARSAPTGSAPGPAYLASTVVLFTEIVKTCVSFVLVGMESGGVARGARAVHKHCSRSYYETLKVSVPSLLYTVQNNLMFFSLLKLSAAVQQVTYQLKILTTALLSVLIMGKALDCTKWSALFLLLAGVLMVQWPRDAQGGGMRGSTPLQGPQDVALGDSSILPAFVAGLHHDQALGFLAVLVACLTSGFASVYLEKLLKQTDASIWMRNVQLGLFGSLMALVVALSQDGEQIRIGGFTQGYTGRVVCIVLTNALGGLLCAAVLKYADNILRCFSTALSIILTCILSAQVLAEYVPDLWFSVGASLAIGSTFLYSLGLPARVNRIRQTEVHTA